MYLSRTKIRNILLGGSGVLLLFLAFLYSDNNMVGFSEFKFLSGGVEVDSLHIEADGAETTGFSVVIYNKEDIDMTYRLGFVDAGITNDSFAQAACLGPNETGQFGKYVMGDTSLFTIPANSSGTKNLSVTFPSYYSGTYTGCIMFFPVMTGISTSVSSGEITTDMNTLPRRGGFISALVHPNVVAVTVKAFPSNHVNQSNNNANTGVLKIYDTSKTLVSTSPLFTLNSAGTGEALIDVSAGVTYYIVFKGQSHLASYLSGKVLTVGTGNFFDFTTGSDLYGAQNLDVETDDGKKYQTAGDLKNTDGEYDFVINGNDISIILYGTFPQLGVGVLEPRNLNGDTAVNASDISIIGANCLKQDVFAAGGLFIW